MSHVRLRTVSLRLRRITFFVEDLDEATALYRDTIGLRVADIRTGWSAFSVAPNVEIAFHKGKGRNPRLEFVTDQALSAVRLSLNEKGVRLGPIKELRGRKMCNGKDRNGNTIQITRE